MNLLHADKNTPDYLPALHGLRGIAGLYVVVSHLGNGGLFLLPFSHEAIGKVGVWIFFSLSAFLLTLNLYRDLEANASRILSVLQYTLHRIFRIYPLYILVLVCHVILGDISDTDFFEHLVLTQGSGELWAIPVEFQYYLMIPLTVVIALYLPLKYCSLLLTVAIIAVLLCGVKQPAIIFSNS